MPSPALLSLGLCCWQYELEVRYVHIVRCAIHRPLDDILPDSGSVSPGMPRDTLMLLYIFIFIDFQIPQVSKQHPQLHLSLCPTLPNWDGKINSRSKIEIKGLCFDILDATSYSIPLSSLERWMIPCLFSLALLRNGLSGHLGDELRNFNRLSLFLKLPQGWAPMAANGGWSPQLCSHTPSSTFILCGCCTFCL